MIECSQLRLQSPGLSFSFSNRSKWRPGEAQYDLDDEAKRVRKVCSPKTWLQQALERALKIERRKNILYIHLNHRKELWVEVVHRAQHGLGDELTTKRSTKDGQGNSPPPKNGSNVEPVKEP
jgi:hypothetical protein